MMTLKKIATTLYLLFFVVYAISPIVASVQHVPSLQSTSGDGYPSNARLMIFEILSGGGFGQETEMGPAKDDERDILLRKKRTIVSNKVSLDAVVGDAPMLLPPPVELLFAYLQAHHAHTSTTHFFISGISPPPLS